MRTDVKIFMVVWFSFLAVVFLIMAVTVLAGRANAQNNPALGIVIPAGMAVFGVALIKFGRWLGRGEERDIVAFLKSTFGASDAG